MKWIALMLAVVLVATSAEARPRKHHKRVVCVHTWDEDVGDRVQCGRLYSRW
jgi:hypothetical protein